MPPKPLIIKKYENRRLYNTDTSQYINQDQVAQLVRDGHDVRVVDAASGENLTRLVLAQIVVEDAKTPGSVFPLDVLRQMIVASGRATQEGALHYMKAMLDMYQNAFRAMPPAMNPLEFMRWPQPAATTAMPPPTGPDEARGVTPPEESLKLGKPGGIPLRWSNSSGGSRNWRPLPKTGRKENLGSRKQNHAASLDAVRQTD